LNITDSYVLFKCINKNNLNRIDSICCSPTTARDLCELSHTAMPPLFNPLYQTDGGNTTGHGTNISKWDPCRKQLYNIVMLLFVYFGKINENLPLYDIKTKLENYTIVILEKLSSLSIHVVKDIIDTIRLRDFYIRKVESQKNLAQILAVRDSAIIHFTKELHEFSNVKYSPLTLSMIQYINLKVYDSFKTTELAKHFFMSESAVRRRFKKEVGMSITEYVNKRKIIISKIFLLADIPISEISKRLGFFDSSHFYRIFKNIEGITPEQFQIHSKDIVYDNYINKEI